MAFLIIPYVNRPQINELRDGRDCLPIVAYIPFFGLFMFFITQFSNYAAINAGMTEETRGILSLYLAHQFWYLCIWNFIIEFIFIIVCIADIVLFLMNSNSTSKYNIKWQKRIYQLRCYIFHGLIVPISTVLGLLVLPLLMHPETKKIILPEEVSKIIPQWMLFSLHTAILYPILVEHTLFVPVMKAHRDISHCMFFFVYWFHIILVLYFYFINQQWLYPILYHIDGTVAGCLAVVGYGIGYVFLRVSIFRHNQRQRTIPRQRKPLD